MRHVRDDGGQLRYHAGCMSGSEGATDGLRPTTQPQLVPSRPGDFHPEPLTDPDLILSHHPARAIARSLPASTERWAHPGEPVGPISGDDLPPSLQPHYKAFITTTEQSVPLLCIGTFGLAVSAARAFSLGITGKVLTFHTRA